MQAETILHDSEATETLSSPSQKYWTSSQESEVCSPQVDPPPLVPHKVCCEQLGEERGIDENGNVVLERSFFERILEKVSEKPCNLKEELQMIRLECNRRFGRDGNPLTDPNEFKELCHTAGAQKIFDVIFDAMSTERQSDNRNMLNEKRVVLIIYIMMFGQSQAANWLQVANTRILKGLGLTSRGVETLRNIGLATHPSTISNCCKKISSAHLESVRTFFEDALDNEYGIDNEYMVIVFIDDYHNIHKITDPRLSPKQRWHIWKLCLSKVV